MLIIFILTLPVVPKRGRGAERTEIPGVGAVESGSGAEGEKREGVRSVYGRLHCDYHNDSAL